MNWLAGAAEAIGDELTLMVDVGYLFNDVPTAVRVCRELEELNIFFFETPFPVDRRSLMQNWPRRRRFRWRWESTE